MLFAIEYSFIIKYLAVAKEYLKKSKNRNENDFINGNYIAVYMMNIKYKDFI